MTAPIAPHIEEAIRAAHAEGGSQKDVAGRVGCSQAHISRCCKALGITLVRGGQGRIDTARARAEEMADLYRRGRTLAEVGQVYGLTRERVRQVLREFTDVTSDQGGATAKAAKRKEKARLARDARSWEKWGCSWADYKAIPLKAKRAYGTQRANAAQRGIEWQFTLASWWGVWQASGKWRLRGRGQGYVMCRHGDEGPYSPTNVFIAPAAVNSSETRSKKSSLPRGVRLVEKGSYRAYTAHRMVGGRKYRLGTFRTPEEAHAAYLRGPQIDHSRHEAAA